MSFDQNNSNPAPDKEQGLSKIPRTLIIGYGNPDREDDGVAWHVLVGIANYFGISTPYSYIEGLFPEGHTLDLWFNLQLTPEMADEMTPYNRICFIDAHTGAVEADIHWQILESKFQNSPLTHHLTPESLMSVLEHVYKRKPEAILVSIRGYQFGFQDILSQRTAELCSSAVESICNWIIQPL
jgi:Ni,Fe-hydrogenase maturation factor